MKPIILYYNQLLNATSKSASETGSGFALDNILDYRPYTIWRASTTGTKALEFEFATQIPFNSIGICNHNIRRLRLINVEMNDKPLDVTINDEDVKLFVFEEFSSNHIKIEVTNNNEVPYCGVIFLAQYLEFPEYPDAPVQVYNEIPELQEEISKAGYILGITYKYYRHQIAISFSNISRSWVDNNYLAFWNNHAKIGKPFFFAYDLENDSNAVYYAWNKGQLNLNKQLRDYYDRLELSMEGIK